MYILLYKKNIRNFSPEPKLKFLSLGGMVIIYLEMNALWILKPELGK